MVLIIIGLLVAGVTGGASLIQSAETRSFMNEILDHRKNLYIFKVAKGRLPGDLNGSGKIGANSGQTYSAGDFNAPYDGAAENSDYGIPNAKTAPYVELYLEGIIDFQPKKVNLESASDGSIPKSKAFPYYSFNIEYISPGSGSPNKGDCLYNRKSGNWLYTDSYMNVSKRISPKVLQQIDLKIDDALDNYGDVRAYCGKIGGSMCLSGEDMRYNKSESCN